MKRLIQRLLPLPVAILLLQAQNPQPPNPESPATGARELFVTVGKSLLVDSPSVIRRVSIANGAIAEALATSPREVLVNGKAPGETSLIVWQESGNRLIFDLIVQPNPARLDAINRELHTELPGDSVSVTLEEGVPFLRGTAKDLTSADRAVMIASTLGKPINLLRVNVPPVEAQILIKVRFADVDRTRSQQLGLNLFSTGATNTVGSVSTQQFSPPAATGTNAGANTFSLTNALNIFLFRPDLNLGATIEALQSRNWLQILAEPNVLTINNHTASFLAGGEFPFPTLQGGGAGLGAVTIQFREFGVRINFTPTVTPRGTIRLQVTPEVSALDFANGLTFQGFTIPGLSTRRVQTEIELESGQSFAIGGLLDNRVTEQLSRIPGLGDIPFFGKLFRSRSLQKNNSELLVIVTPEIVRPIPAGQPLPQLSFPRQFMQPNTAATAPRTPGVEATGPVPVHPPQETIPMEDLLKSVQPPGSAQQQGQPSIQFVPMIVPPGQETAPPARPATTPAQNPAQPAAAPNQ
ncbi:MAG: pilus assembly protein N-terminal domain-containing protein [Acidobacteriia bacterium]|nr:pilus assembly protein N-terminal domain-containing protein [Terriglobia bacterium]